MEQNKTFDAVKMMREIREKLSEKYWKHPELLKQEMQKIREKYNLNISELATAK
jgi:DNA-binding transcriptional regulator YiaG